MYIYHCKFGSSTVFIDSTSYIISRVRQEKKGLFVQKAEGRMQEGLIIRFCLLLSAFLLLTMFYFPSGIF